MEPSNLDRVKSFDTLFAELSEKAAARPSGSRTVTELESGVHGIGKKTDAHAAAASRVGSSARVRMEVIGTGGAGRRRDGRSRAGRSARAR